MLYYRWMRQLDHSVRADPPEALEELIRGDRLAFRIRNAALTPASRSRIIRGRDGQSRLLAPWLSEARASLTRFGVSELAGTQIVPDSPAHRDFRPANVVNVHYTAEGSVQAYFALVADSEHDELLELPRPLLDYANDVGGVEACLSAGDTICFMGGVVTHQFVSLSATRLSVTKAFVV